MKASLYIFVQLTVHISLTIYFIGSISDAYITDRKSFFTCFVCFSNIVIINLVALVRYILKTMLKIPFAFYLHQQACVAFFC